MRLKRMSFMTECLARALTLNICVKLNGEVWMDEAERDVEEASRQKLTLLARGWKPLPCGIAKNARCFSRGAH